MSSPFCAYLASLRLFPIEALQSGLLYFRRPGKDFTRRRLLFLERLAWLNVGLLRKSLCIELDHFFSWLDSDTLPATKSALVQARQKLLPRFFKDFFQRSSESFYKYFEARRWLGFRLWAADGSGFRLPDTTELGEVFGWHGNQHNRVPSARMLLFFDVLNKIITDVHFHARTTSEFVIAMRAIARLPKDVLVIYDRGFASHLIPLLHIHYGTQCLIRIPVGFSNTVKTFVKSGKNQAIITESIQLKARLAMNELGLFYPATAKITYRLIRITLSTGETEVLLTTLLDKKRYYFQRFSQLYRRRWGVETCFFVLKSFFQLANFSAVKPDSCWQDIYSTLILYNIQSASLAAVQPKIDRINKRRIHDYQPNRNLSGGLLKRYLIEFFLKPVADVEAAINRYFHQILQQLEPIRPDQAKERRRRLMRGTERHSHEKNYRRAF